jgi:hypothetical protein
MSLVNTHSIGDKTYCVLSSVSTNTGTTTISNYWDTNVAIRTINMPPNIFTVGDVVTIEACMSKQGSNGTYQYNVYWSTNSTLTANGPQILVGVSGTVPSTATYSNFYRKLVILGTASSTQGTKVMVDNDIIAAQSGIDLNPVNNVITFDKVGAYEVKNSINWEQAQFDEDIYLNGGYFIVAGGVSNSNDRLRCEWIKISGMASGSFDIPVGR